MLTMHYFLILCLLFNVVTCQRRGSNVAYRPNTCLLGDKHNNRTYPEPENNRYKACHQWKDAACCTPEFTIQLANANVSNIDGFHWSRCGPLSKTCQKFFIEIECFYRCSPNIGHFANLDYHSALANLPLCGDYCERWYDACKDDMTCAENWITDWNYFNGSNHCKDNAICRSYSVVYQNGRGICEKLWGSSFFYSNYSSSDSDHIRQCLVPYFPINSTNPNNVVINTLFSREINGNTRGVIVTFSLTIVMLTLSVIANV